MTNAVLSLGPGQSEGGHIAMRAGAAPRGDAHDGSRGEVRDGHHHLDAPGPGGVEECDVIHPLGVPVVDVKEIQAGVPEDVEVPAAAGPSVVTPDGVTSPVKKSESK